MPGHLVALELNGKLLVGGRPELYPLRLPLRARRARRARARGRASARRRRALRARREAAAGRVARRDAPPPARPRRRPDVLRVARRAPGRRRPDVPGHRDALDGRAGGDHRRAPGTGLLRARLELRLGPLAQHRRRRRRAHRRHRGRAGRARRARRRGARGRPRGRARARALPPGRRRARAARAARDRRHQGVRRRAADPRPARRDEQRAERDPLRADRRHGDAHERDAADALGRPLRARDSQARVQHALQHRQRAASAQSACARPAAASWSTAPAMPR